MGEVHSFPPRRRFSAAAEQRLDEIRQLLREAEPKPSALEQLDADAIIDRRVFKRRFGFDWPLRFHRAALVQLRQERDWTDSEVKLFLYAGALRRGPFGVQPDASFAIALLGGALMVTMLLLAVLVAGLSVERFASLSFEQVWRGLAGIVVYSGATWIVYQLCVRPWRIQRRSTATHSLP